MNDFAVTLVPPTVRIVDLHYIWLLGGMATLWLLAGVWLFTPRRSPRPTVIPIAPIDPRERDRARLIELTATLREATLSTPQRVELESLLLRAWAELADIQQRDAQSIRAALGDSKRLSQLDRWLYAGHPVSAADLEALTK